MAKRKAVIIAELGINHQGDFGTLLALTDMALQAGADSVKIQIRTPEVCVPRDQWGKEKVTPWGTTETYLEYRKKMEFSDEQLWALDAYIKANYPDKTWFASVWDIPSLDRYQKFGLPVKVPSAKITDEDLLSAIRKSGLPVIMSTGMSTMQQIQDAARILDEAALLSCNSAYPTPDKDVNLAAIHTLKKMFPGRVVGFSSHHVSPLIPIYAIVLGAEIIEVHVTLDRTMTGSDHAASLERPGLSMLCREAARISELMGDGVLRVTDGELGPMKKLRG